MKKELRLLIPGDKEIDRVCGAHVRDMLTGDEWDVHAKCVVNATGPYTDSIRKMANKESKEICETSSGIHIVLPEYYWYLFMILNFLFSVRKTHFDVAILLNSETLHKTLNYTKKC